MQDTTDPQLIEQNQSSIDGWPADLPSDEVQPWERTDSEGHAVLKNPSGINPDTEYCFGAQEWDRSASALDSGDIMELDATSGTCWAMYRIPLGGSQPGAVNVDANIYPDTSLELSEYWVGLSNYEKGAWDWYGPFEDAHVRLSTGSPSTSMVSPLGSLFVCVVADDGNRIDLVGAGANPIDPGDTEAPPQVSGLSMEPHSGILELTWNDVIADDLAGYRVYYRSSSFIDGNTLGVHSMPYLVGGTRCLLPVEDTTYVRVCAVDISGNRGPVSDIAMANPIDGPPLLVMMAVDAPSVLVNDPVELNALGAESYDWDLDGDGFFDVVGDTTGIQNANTGSAGVIRPLVRGVSGGGTAVAHGAVSVLVSGNSRPVVQAYVDDSTGVAPHTVNFSSTQTDFDGTIVEREWYFTGDTNVSWQLSTAGGAENPDPYVYSTPGLYNSKVKVWDDGGAWDVDTVAVLVSDTAANMTPVAIITSVLECDAGQEVLFDGQQSFDLDGTIVQYEWDLNGDGLFEYDSSPAFWAQSVFNIPGVFEVGLRVTDDQAAQGTTAILMTVHGIRHAVPDTTDNVGQYTSLAGVNGNPAISYYDFTNGYLMYVRANDSTGTAWTAPVEVDTATDSGWQTSLAVVAGNPAISYLDSTDRDLMYVRATDANGTAWAAPVAVDTVGFVGQWSSLAVVDGNPAISHVNDTSGVLLYARATDSTGTAWSASVVIPAGSAADTSLAVVDGNPAISFLDLVTPDLKYVRATDSTGSAWAAPVSVDTVGNVGYDNSLAIVDGYPAISYGDGTNGHLKYVRAADSTGSAWALPVTVDTDGIVGIDTSLAVVDGIPAISYYDDTNDDLKFVRALDSIGTAWASPLAVDMPGDVGRYTSLAVVGGKPAISYYDATYGDLRYLRFY